MVFKPSKRFLQVALTNNSFDVDATEKTLRMALDHSFSYLYRLQRNMIQYEEFFYTTRNDKEKPDFGDLYLDKRSRVCFNVPVELVTPSGRERYRHSDYYGREVGYAEFDEDHTVFPRFPVITVDGHILRSCKILLYDDFFTVILPFKRDFLYTKKFINKEWNYEYIHHTISVQIINNTLFKDLVTNLGMMRVNSYDGQSLDRIRLSYCKDNGSDPSTRHTGTYFAVIYKKDEVLGSGLQDVEIDENGDFVIHYEENLLNELNGFTGEITIRFIFYRYLYAYDSFRYDGENHETKMVPIRKHGDEVTSERFLIRDKDGKNLGMPVPSENLILFKVPKKEEDIQEERTLISNSSASVAYPNIYHFDGGDDGDRIRVFYFYIPPYDLRYTYMYQFYYDYLTYKWNEYSLEEIINRIYFGDLTHLFSEKMRYLDDIAIVYQIDLMVTEKRLKKLDAGRFFWFARKNNRRGVSMEELETRFFNALENGDLMSSEEVPLKIKDFIAIFNYVIKHKVVDYYYDEIDYIKNYGEKVPPLVYKVRKLQSFINDNPETLRDYVLGQNRVGIKYEFSFESGKVRERYREYEEETGKKLLEPMYLFKIDKSDPNEKLTARVFIDGFFCSNFIYQSFEFVDYLYVPVAMATKDSYFEIEIFPALLQDKTVTFTKKNPSVTIELCSSKTMTPTLSDLFFYFGKEETYERIPPESFKLEITSTRYNYYADSSISYGEGEVLNSQTAQFKAIYYNKMIPIAFLNPDELQLNLEEIKAKYPLIYKLYGRMVEEDETYIKPYKDPNAYDSGNLDVDENGNTVIDPFPDKSVLKEVPIYWHTKNGHKVIGEYFDAEGRCYSLEGQRLRSSDISAEEVTSLVESGDLVEGVGYLTDDELSIERDKNYVDYLEVANGASTINSKNEAVNSTFISKVKITALPEDIFGKEVTISLSKRPMYYSKTTTESVFAFFDVFLGNVDGINEYARAFKDGRLISRNRYSFDKREDGKMYFVSFEKMNKGSSMSLDITPYRNRLVMYIQELSSDVIDLRGYINKPFDMRYYEVYLNGRRLNQSNVFPISPWEIKLAGIHSIYNLEIYEKDRDWEYYGFNQENYFTLSDFIRASFMENDLKNKLIHDVTGDLPENNNIEDKQPWSRDHDLKSILLEMFYYDRMIPLKMLDPNRVQISKEEVLKKYSEIEELFGEDDMNGSHVIHINPDIAYHPPNVDEKDRRWLVYRIGNTDDGGQVIPVEGFIELLLDLSDFTEESTIFATTDDGNNYQINNLDDNIMDGKYSYEIIP